MPVAYCNRRGFSAEKQIPPSPPKENPGISLKYRDFYAFSHIFSAQKFNIAMLDRTKICGFPLRFPLLIDGAYKLLHSGSTVPLHLIGNMSVYIKGKGCRRMA